MMDTYVDLLLVTFGVIFLIGGLAAGVLCIGSGLYFVGVPLIVVGLFGGLAFIAWSWER